MAVLIRNRNLNNSLFISGNGKRVDISNTGLQWQPGSNSFTIHTSLLGPYKSSSGFKGTIFSNLYTSLGYYLEIREDIIQSYWWDGSAAYSLNNFRYDTSNVRDVTVVYTPTSHKIFLNGNLISETAYAATSKTVNTSRAISIGGRSGTNGFDIQAYVADFQIYGEALTDAEVVTIVKNQGRQFKDKAPLRHYKFDSKNGKTAIDSGFHALDGTLIGFTDAETANAGQPQSGNTVWCDAYSKKPIVI